MRNFPAYGHVCILLSRSYRGGVQIVQLEICHQALLAVGEAFMLNA
jgi:hypothetical protein